ncbi:MAG: gamma-glutamylcyclotransferase [Alphaproteobacteria bacterium]
MTSRNDRQESATYEAIAAEGERLGLYRRMTPAERAASRRATLARLPAGEDVWLFAYGSLMWKPGIACVERRSALIHGHHRRFCLWTLGRGTPERPGLTLALAAGGSCRGVALRIAADLSDRELEKVWDREMAGGAYDPRIVTARTADGPVTAVAFVIDRNHERYAGRLTPDAMAETIARAEGRLGRCSDYLFSTVAHLDALGFRDRPLHDLARLVRARMATAVD